MICYIITARDPVTPNNSEDIGTRRCKTARACPSATTSSGRISHTRNRGISGGRQTSASSRVSTRKHEEKPTCKMWSTDWYETANLPTPRPVSSTQSTKEPINGFYAYKYIEKNIF